MSDLKSKLPDLKELADMTGKFFKDIKKSVCEIVEDYQKKREEDLTTRPSDVVSSAPIKPVSEEPVPPPVPPVNETNDKPQP